MKALLRAERYAQRGGSLAMAHRSIRRAEEGQVWCLIFWLSTLPDRSSVCLKKNMSKRWQNTQTWMVSFQPLLSFFVSNAKYRLIWMIPDDKELNYVERSATASIHIGKDAYFDNMTILEQFERLFQLIQFKEAFKGHRIECIVDNARSHTARSYSVFEFGKSIGTRCPVDKIEYKDSQGSSKILHCYFQTGPNQGKSKGLLAIAKELDIKMPPTIKLQELQKLLADHQAFKTVED